MRDRQLLLIEAPARRCTLCGRPYGRPNPGCVRCQQRRDPPPPAAPDPGLEGLAAAAASAARARAGYLTGLERPVRVALLGCSASKRPGVHKARDLYIGAFFRRALPIAERSCDETWILSARYGLVRLDQELPTYDEQLPTRRRERASGAPRSSPRSATHTRRSRST